MKRILEDKCQENVEVFNIGTGHGVSVMELVNTFEKCTGVKLNYQIAPRRAGDIEKMVAAYVQEKIEEEMLETNSLDPFQAAWPKALTSKTGCPRWRRLFLFVAK